MVVVIKEISVITPSSSSNGGGSHPPRACRTTLMQIHTTMAVSRPTRYSGRPNHRPTASTRRCATPTVSHSRFCRATTLSMFWSICVDNVGAVPAGAVPAEFDSGVNATGLKRLRRHRDHHIDVIALEGSEALADSAHLTGAMVQRSVYQVRPRGGRSRLRKLGGDSKTQ